MTCRLSVIAVTLTASIVSAAVQGDVNPSFQVNLGEDGETIGEMRPVFLEMSSQTLPAISMKEVARRYQRLFEEADEPEVRIDALHRLTNLHSLAGDGLALSPEQEAVIYREALKSYEMIVSQGRYQGRLDELLYQTAKAYAFIGNEERSNQRLKQLVGLYPRSTLAPEARFRIAENAFSRASYAEAELAYEQVIRQEKREKLREKARYMKGWSQYKQQKLSAASHTFFGVLDGYAMRSDNFTQLHGGSMDLVNDSFRILALMAAQQGGAAELDSMLAAEGGRSYDYLLYDRLADYYLSKQRYTDSVAVNRHFIESHPAHPRSAAMRAQVVVVWEKGGFERKARQAREDFVQAYATPDRYTALSPYEQARWRSFGRQVADTLYREGSLTSGHPDRQALAQAGLYYGRLGDIDADRSEAVAAGEYWRLAGDAFLLSKNEARAAVFFDKAGYDAQSYAGAADAAWAAILIYRKQPSPKGDDRIIAAVDRYAAAFADDGRVAPAQADLANRLLAAGRWEEARKQAQGVVARADGPQAAKRSAYLVLGQIAYNSDQYADAEGNYRQALALAGAGQKPMAQEQVAATRDQMARSIYRQAEAEEANGQTEKAVAHFQRIPAIGATATIGMNAQYDAATALLKASRWQPAVDQLQSFRRQYPDAELTGTVSDSLVMAYRESGQPRAAADELLTRAEQSASPWDDRLQASSLLIEAGDDGRAHMIIGDYLAQAPAPESAEAQIRQQSLRQQLIAAAPADSDLMPMREELVTRELESQWHSEESLTWAASSALILAASEAQHFESIPLALPLKQSLQSKRRALESAVARYQQAGQLGGPDARAHALFGKAELFRTLASDIMGSERPQKLSELERVQYDVLLEEQAYPFEEKAIALHARNHQQIAEGIYNVWIRRSLEALGDMFPGRYRRDNQWMEWKNEEVGYARAPEQ